MKTMKNRVVLCFVFGLASGLVVPGIAHAQFTDIGAGITDVSSSGVAWGDYDNDGDLDILITGFDTGFNPASQVWRNDGMDTFTNIMAGLTGVFGSSAAWGDYDNDGDLDILITGRNAGNNPASQVWRNDGMDTFTDIMAGLTGVNSGDAAWGDYDNDGDLDILVTGTDGGNNPVSQVWRNDGMDTFTNIMAGLTGVESSSAAWGDYDNDGDLDILLAGSDSGGRVSEVWRNDGMDTFTNIMAGLTGVAPSSVAWGDYDNDGNLDILITGFGSGGPVSQVWRNDGMDTFTNIMAGLTGVNSGDAAWGDYDNDGDLDILLTGRDTGSNRFSQVWRNDLPPATGHTFTDIMAGITAVDLSSGEWGDYDNDGDMDFALMGRPGVNASAAKIWRNDGGGMFADIMAGLPNLYNGDLAWADYDNDGDLDLLLTGQLGGGFVTQLRRNDGSDTFTDVMAGITPIVFSSVDWGDYDNDGDLDIVLTGWNSSFVEVSQVWRNNLDDPMAMTPFTDIAAGLTGVRWSGATWVDYDNDGDLDIFINGHDASDSPFAEIYNNNGGIFTAIGAGITPTGFASADWTDYDNDGDLDVAITGNTLPSGDMNSFSTQVTQVWRNDGGGVFTDIMAGIAGVERGNGGESVDWGDYDNDGDPDLLITGQRSGNRVSEVWRNDGMDTFTNIGAGLPGLIFSSVAWGDYDIDGDLDFLLSGLASGSTWISRVYQNDSCSVFIDVFSNSVPADGATGETIDVTTTLQACDRTAVSNDMWITVTGGGMGTGDGMVTYDVDPNPGAARMGTITVGGHTFTVNQDACVAPMVTQQPMGQTSCDGTASFMADASGTPSPLVQWQIDTGSGFNDIPGENATTLMLTGLSSADSGNLYRAVFTNGCGSVMTNAATLTAGPPVIAQDPEDQAACDGTATFSVVATNADSIQWQVDDGSGFMDLPGENGASLNLNGVTADMSGNQYRAVLTNTCGDTTSAAAAILNVGSPMRAPAAFTASDGEFTDYVRLDWRPVDGSTGYRVFRSENRDLSDAIDVSGVVTDRGFLDTSANVPRGMGCFANKPQKFYYYVVAVNGCGDGPASASDSGVVKHTHAAGLDTTNGGDFGLLLITLAAMWGYQRRRKIAVPPVA